MDHQVEQDKSEQPTSFKLDRARKKGSVARGLDLGFLTGLAAFLGYSWIAGPQLAVAIMAAGRNAFVTGPRVADNQTGLVSIVGLLAAPLVRSVLVLLATSSVTVLLFEFLQTGVVFSAEPLKPDFSRLNPANGLKRLFSLRLLLETIKNILKLIVYATLAIVVVRGALATDVGGIADARSLAAAFGRYALRLIACFTLGAILFAVLDQLIARRCEKRVTGPAFPTLAPKGTCCHGDPTCRPK
jgi:flagellar biosynthetic protein FlhB